MTQSKLTIVPNSDSHQSGIALVTVLMLLLAVTLVGVTSFRMNMSDEIMARNSYLRAQAEEAAQITLRAAEDQILALAGTANSIDKAVFFCGGAVDNDLLNCNDGDTCTNGFCTPMRRSLNYNPLDPDLERWVDKSTSNSLKVWSTAGKTQEVSADIKTQLNLPNSITQTPQYIVEFMGYTPDTNDTDKLKFSFCDEDRNGVASGDRVADWDIWPFCSSDHKMYRITAYAQAGSARVMLQSVYLTP